MHSSGLVRKLYIHVGPMKTGSSAVQHFFITQDDLPLLYPRVGLWADGAHHNLVQNFYGDYRRPEIVRSDIGEMFAEIGRLAAARPGDLLISSEALVGRDVGALVRALLPHLGKDAWQPEILIVFREHFARISSLYNQAVKDGFALEQGEPDDFLRRNTHSYADMVRRMELFGFPLTPLNYHPSETFLPRFLAQVGIAGGGGDNEPRNVSLSVPALIAALAVNVTADTADQRRRYFDAVRRMTRFFAPSRFIFGRHAAEAAEIVFREDRRFLSDRFGITLSAPELALQDNMFCIDESELEEIAAVTRDLGSAGDAIVAFARRYVKPRAEHQSRPLPVTEKPAREISEAAAGGHPQVPVFAYWHSADLTPIGQTLADWRPHFADFRVVGDAEIIPLVEKYFPEFGDLYPAIHIPQAKADVARLLAMYEWGGLYVDCHYAVADPPGVRRLIGRLREFEAIFVDRDRSVRKPETHWIINGCMLGRAQSPLFLEMAALAFANLTRQRQDEAAKGFVPYNIFALTGSEVVTEVLTEPGSDKRQIRRDLMDRILIVPEEELPLQRSVWKTYVVNGMQWHIRQQSEPLFAPLGASSEAEARQAPAEPVERRMPERFRADSLWEGWARTLITAKKNG